MSAPFRFYADFTGADPRFREPKRPESAAECVLGKCPDPGFCDLMTNCDAWTLRRDRKAVSL